MDSDTKALLEINHRLHIIAKKSILSLVHIIKDKRRITPSSAELILVSYCYKALDLFQGIMKLQKCNLMEDAQILIRVLFETNLNFGAFIKLSSETDNYIAAKRVFEAMMIMKGRDASEQHVDDSSFQAIVGDIQLNYSKDQINKIKKYGFTLSPIYQRAKNDNKIAEYNIMYRNFSRNVHAFDFQEYLDKTGILSSKDTYEENYVLRNQVALWHSHRCFFQIIAYMNKFFELGIDAQLKKKSRRLFASIFKIN